MWIAVTEFGTGNQILFNTLSGMRIQDSGQEGLCSIEIKSEFVRIKADFNSLVLSLQAMDLRR